MSKSITGVGVLIIIALVIVMLVACAFCNEYTINFWLAFAGSEAVFPFWACVLITFIPGLGQICLPAAMITFIISFFI